MTRLEWEKEMRPAWRRRWLDLLGAPSFSPEDFEPEADVIDEGRMEDFEVTSYRQATGPGQWQKVLLLRPRDAATDPLPCAVIPFYHPEISAGLVADSGRNGLRLDPHESQSQMVRRYGLHLVRRGFLVACTEAYPFNTVREPGGDDPFRWWRAAAEKLRQDHPGWTGLGKLVHDTQCALSLLLRQPGADASRVAAMGHSLGGKMAFYTGCLDQRISAVIASDFGLPWASTNWGDPWYLGAKRPGAESDLAHEKLLALLAPRPFFLIAGETDTSESWSILEAARPYYELYGGPIRLDGINHTSGHDPTPESLHRAYDWLDEVFRRRSGN